MKQISPIFNLLVASDADLSGYVAYAIYKRQKIELLEQLQNEGKSGTEIEAALSAFVKGASTETSLQLYRDKADSIMSNMVMDAVQEPMAEYEREILLDYQTQIKKALPGWWKSILQSVIGAFVFSIIASLFFFIGLASERGTREFVETIVSVAQTQQSKDIKAGNK